MWRILGREAGRLIAAAFFAIGVVRADELSQGITAYHARDYAEAFVRLAPLAERGVPEAMYVLGEMYRKGEGLVQDRAEAQNLLKRAAEAGHVPAALALAQLFEAEGEGQDLAAAVAWLRRAAQSGSDEACFQLGLYHIRVEAHRDFPEAALWLRRAAEKGHAEAQYFLGRLLLDGRGLSANVDEARAWFQLAARQGHVRAQRFLRVLALPDTPDRGLALRELRRQLAAGVARLTGVATDPGYGGRDDPIRAGSDYGAEWAYLNALRGPHGEVVHYRSLGPCCFFVHPDAPRGRAFLDRYEVEYDGAPPVILHFTLFAGDTRLEAPAGFSYLRPTGE
jgi:TPR repeat protein